MVDWKQGILGGTIWDWNAIDQKAVQKITQDGKKDFYRCYRGHSFRSCVLKNRLLINNII